MAQIKPPSVIFFDCRDRRPDCPMSSRSRNAHPSVAKTKNIYLSGRGRRPRRPLIVGITRFISVCHRYKTKDEKEIYHYGFRVVEGANPYLRDINRCASIDGYMAVTAVAGGASPSPTGKTFLLRQQTNVRRASTFNFQFSTFNFTSSSAFRSLQALPQGLPRSSRALPQAP